MHTTLGLTLMILVANAANIARAAPAPESIAPMVAAPKRHILLFDATGPLYGLYALTFKHPLKTGLIGRMTGAYENRLMGHLTINRFPGNIESSYDAYGALGLEWHPFALNYGKRAWLAGLYGVSEIALGHHATVMQSWRSPQADSNVARGNWLAPTFRIGYEGVLMERLIVSPEIGMLYRFNRVNYAGLGPEFFEPNRTVVVASRGDLKSDHKGWQPVFGVSVGHRF